jgi:hypothetical protein
MGAVSDIRKRTDHICCLREISVIGKIMRSQETGLDGQVKSTQDAFSPFYFIFTLQGLAAKNSDQNRQDYRIGVAGV